MKGRYICEVPIEDCRRMMRHVADCGHIYGLGILRHHEQGVNDRCLLTIDPTTDDEQAKAVAIAMGLIKDRGVALAGDKVLR